MRELRFNSRARIMKKHFSNFSFVVDIVSVLENYFQFPNCDVYKLKLMSTIYSFA